MSCRGFLIHVRISMKGGCDIVLRTEFLGGWSDCRGSAFGRGGRSRGSNFLGSVLDRDRVDRDPCNLGAHRSGYVTGGCRLSTVSRREVGEERSHGEGEGLDGFLARHMRSRSSILGHRGGDGRQRCSFSQLLTRRKREEVYDE